jgi:FxsC-like protein
MGPERAGDAPYFFLSYARTPRHDPHTPSDPNQWVHRLYHDLCEEVLQLIRTRNPGFMDRDIRVGAPWSKDVSAALAACRVFVPLYSPRYFVSENCGKEWLAFSKRVLDQQARQPGTRMAIVPALWVPVEEQSLPRVAKDIQFNHHELGEVYGKRGFYGIIKLQRYRDEYLLAVQELARRIVDVANEASIDPGPRADYTDSESAFDGSDVHQASEKNMQLTVVAADTAHLPNGRSKEYYGPKPYDWRPYFPDAPMPITDYARQLTYYLGCQPSVSTLDEHVKDAADGSGGPGLFLVDAWATRSTTCRKQLQLLDELNQDWTSVLVPWNREDDQTVRAERRLRENLSSCLGNKLASIPRRFGRDAIYIESIEDFGDAMAPMVMTLLRKYLKQAESFAPSGPPTERPRLRAYDF